MNQDPDKLYKKISGMFKCGNDGCYREWGSTHVWAGLKAVCKGCGVEAKVIRKTIVYGFMDICHYRCSVEECENTWKVLKEGGALAQDNCDKCGSPGIGKTWNQFGFSYWVLCNNKKCLTILDYKDFTLGPPKDQECKRCKVAAGFSNPLKIVPKKMEEPEAPRKPLTKEQKEKISEPPGPAGTGIHDEDLCEMCKKLQNQGKGFSCRGLRKVYTQDIVIMEEKEEIIIKTEM